MTLLQLNQFLLGYMPIVLSSLGVVFTIHIWIRQNRAASITACLSHFLNIEREIEKNPNFLRFHGISEQELLEAGFTVKEFCYLLANFTAGEIYHRSVNDKKTTPFKEAEYRYKILEQEDTQRIWPFVSKMFGNSFYVKRINNTLKAIEQKNILLHTARPILTTSI